MPQAMIMPKKYFFDSNGEPLAFGKVYTYAAGTTDLKQSFTTEVGDVANTNPVILNGEGYASIYLSGSYNIVVDDVDDVNIWTEDPVSSNIADEWVGCQTPTFISSTSFKLSGNLTNLFSVGRRVRINNNVPTLVYSSIKTSSFAAGETTIEVVDAVVDAAITEVCVSIISVQSIPRIEFNSVADAKLSDLDEGMLVRTLGYSAAGDGGGASYRVAAAQLTDGFGDHTIGNGNSLLIDEKFIHLRQYGLAADWNGATGTDNSAALQALVDRAIPFFDTGGEFAFDTAVQWKQGAAFFGGGYSFYPDAHASVTRFVYSGAGGANTGILNISTAAIGSEPGGGSPVFADNIQAVQIENVTLDGNDLAEFGFYAVRAGLQSSYKRITVINTLKHAFYATSMWDCVFEQINAFSNQGAGITLGRNIFGFSDSIVNACSIVKMKGQHNGLNALFDETTNPTEGYGVGLFVARGNHISEITGEINYGPGVVLGTSSGSNYFGSIYCEGNCVDFSGAPVLTAGRPYGLWVEGQAGGASANIVIETLYLQGNEGSAATERQSIRLAGIEPFGNERHLTFRNIFGGFEINASWGNYRIESAPEDIIGNCVNHYPQANDPDTVTPETPLTTLYVRNAAAGNENGQTAGNPLASLQTAIDLAGIITTVTAINVDGITKTGVISLDGRKLKRRLAIDGNSNASIAQAGSGSNALELHNFLSELKLLNINGLEQTFVKDSNVVFNGTPVKPTGTATNGGLTCRESNIVLTNGSNIDMVNHTGGSKRGLEMNGGVCTFDGDTVANASSGFRILMRSQDSSGVGTVYSDSTAAFLTGDIFWGNGAGMVQTNIALHLKNQSLVS